MSWLEASRRQRCRDRRNRFCAPAVTTTLILLVLCLAVAFPVGHHSGRGVDAQEEAPPMSLSDSTDEAMRMKAFLCQSINASNSTAPFNVTAAVIAAVRAAVVGGGTMEDNMVTSSSPASSSLALLPLRVDDCTITNGEATLLFAAPLPVTAVVVGRDNVSSTAMITQWIRFDRLNLTASGGGLAVVLKSMATATTGGGGGLTLFGDVRVDVVNSVIALSPGSDRNAALGGAFVWFGGSPATKVTAIRRVYMSLINSTVDIVSAATGTAGLMCVMDVSDLIDELTIIVNRATVTVNSTAWRDGSVCAFGVVGGGSTLRVSHTAMVVTDSVVVATSPGATALALGIWRGSGGTLLAESVSISLVRSRVFADAASSAVAVAFAGLTFSGSFDLVAVGCIVQLEDHCNVTAVGNFGLSAAAGVTCRAANVNVRVDGLTVSAGDSSIVLSRGRELSSSVGISLFGGSVNATIARTTLAALGNGIVWCETGGTACGAIGVAIGGGLATASVHTMLLVASGNVSVTAKGDSVAAALGIAMTTYGSTRCLSQLSAVVIVVLALDGARCVATARSYPTACAGVALHSDGTAEIALREAVFLALRGSTVTAVSWKATAAVGSTAHGNAGASHSVHESLFTLRVTTRR